MQPLVNNGSVPGNNPGVIAGFPVISDSRVVTNDNAHEVPLLNLEQITTLAEGGDRVVPYYTPRGTYDTLRTDLTDQTVALLFRGGRTECLLRNYTITIPSAERIRDQFLAPGCGISTLKFVNCGLLAEAFTVICDGLAANKSVRTLQFEGCVCKRDICLGLGRLLSSRENALSCLNFANVTIVPDAFQELVTSVVSQNDQPHGLDTLSFEGCRLNEHYADVLKQLFLSQKLQNLVLQGNQLGGAKVLSHKKMPEDITPSTPPGNRSERAPSKAIAAISEGLRANTTLVNLILASNRLSITDYQALSAVCPNDGNLNLNLTGNFLPVPSTPRVITEGSSPRSIASPLEIPQLAIRERSGSQSSRVVILPTQTFGTPREIPQSGAEESVSEEIGSTSISSDKK
jgi:hypothetical protein